MPRKVTPELEMSINSPQSLSFGRVQADHHYRMRLHQLSSERSPLPAWYRKTRNSPRSVRERNS